MGTGKAKSGKKGNVAKKRGGKKSSGDASEKKLLKEQLDLICLKPMFLSFLFPSLQLKSRRKLLVF